MLIAMTRTTRLVPFRGHETWVQITAPENARTGALPLFVLHGGPGMAHNYVRNIAELAGGDRADGHPLRPDRVRQQHPSARRRRRLLDAGPLRRRVPHRPRCAGHRRVPPAGPVLGRHVERGDRGPPTVRARLPGDLQFARVDGALDGRGRRVAGPAAARYPGGTRPSRGGGHRHRPGVPRGHRRVLPAPCVPRRSDATGFRRHHRADGGGADGLPHHERAQRVSRSRHAARVEHHRPAAPDHRAHARHRRRVRRGHPRDLAAVRRAHPRRRKPRVRRHQPLHAPREARGVPRRRRRVPHQPRCRSPHQPRPTRQETHGRPAHPRILRLQAGIAPLGGDRRPARLRAGVHGADRAVGDLRHGLQQCLGHGAAGLPHRLGGHGVHGDGVRADGANRSRWRDRSSRMWAAESTPAQAFSPVGRSCWTTCWCRRCCTCSPPNR